MTFDQFRDRAVIKQCHDPERKTVTICVAPMLSSEKCLPENATEREKEFAAEELLINLHRQYYDRHLRRLLDLRRACPDLPPEGKQILDTVIDELWTRKASTSLQNSSTSPPNAN
jgi:hypothetical protein